MIRSIAFKFLRMMHFIIDNCISLLFRGRFRQSYVRFSYRVKRKLFPEYGGYIPELSEIGPTPQHTDWIQPSVPNWVIDEMKVLARHVDPIIYPSDNFLANCQFYSFPIRPKPGQIYHELLKNCSSDKYTHCFAIPWLKRGGADLVTIKHIEVLANIKSSKILVLMTEPGDSPWLSRIPSNVDIINASLFAKEISHDEYLTRLLIQLEIDVLHIINSRHVWEVVCRNGLAITQSTKIFASIYCDDYDQFGQPVGFARQYLPDCYRSLTRVFSDNNYFPLLLRQTYGYNSDLFCVLKSPVDLSLSISSVRKPNGRKVLWAGRLDRQKRPDLLLGIAQALPDVEFHVYGDAVLDNKSGVVRRLAKLANVRMLGGFDGVESLPFNEYPVYLYTSQWDGTPTMVIAAALASIPIVASRVGGVGDIVSEERGYPVSNVEDIDLYVARIREVLSESNLAESKAFAARSYVMKEHSDAAFSDALLDVPGYISKISI